MTDPIETITTNLTPNENGGEAVTVTTTVYDNGDHNARSKFTVTTITLQSYGRSVDLELGDAFDNGQLEEHLQRIDEAKSNF